MMKIVIPYKVSDKTRHLLSSDPKYWKVVLEIEGKDIPLDLPLTESAISYWKENKFPITNYVNFKTLTKDDILSILSAVKRQEARLSVNRWGQVSCYKILKDVE